MAGESENLSLHLTFRLLSGAEVSVTVTEDATLQETWEVVAASLAVVPERVRLSSGDCVQEPVLAMRVQGLPPHQSGWYTKLEVDGVNEHGGRPIYHNRGGQYLFYWGPPRDCRPWLSAGDFGWRIGPDYRCDSGDVRFRSNRFTPARERLLLRQRDFLGRNIESDPYESPTAQWEHFVKGEWKPDASITIEAKRCAKVTRGTCSMCGCHVHISRNWYQRCGQDLCTNHWAELEEQERFAYTWIDSCARLESTPDLHTVYDELSSVQVSHWDVESAVACIVPCADTWVLNIPAACKNAHCVNRMPPVITKYYRGNSGMTVIVNIHEIARVLQRPAMYIVKFWGYFLGTQGNKDAREKGDYTLNGNHVEATLQALLDEFIEDFVLCPKCRTPTSTLIVDGFSSCGNNHRRCSNGAQRQRPKKRNSERSQDHTALVTQLGKKSESRSSSSPPGKDSICIPSDTLSSSSSSSSSSSNSSSSSSSLSPPSSPKEAVMKTTCEACGLTSILPCSFGVTISRENRKAVWRQMIKFICNWPPSSFEIVPVAVSE